MQEALNLEGNDKPFIKGRHLVTIFHNDSNMYSVVRVRVTETNVMMDEKEAVVTGYFPMMHEEEVYTFTGKMKEHPRFGMQFHADSFRREMPSSKEGVIAYLSSDLFHGIGKRTAETIVDHLGSGAITKIMASPSVLDTVPKLSSEKAKVIIDALIENQGMEHVMIGLNDFGFGPQISTKIYQTYQEKAIQIIEENPFQLIEDVEGIGFGRADEVGHQLGFHDLHPFRVRAGLLFVVNQLSMKQGHTFVPSDELVQYTSDVLNKNPSEIVEQTLITDQLAVLDELEKVVWNGDNVFMPSLYFAEKGIASNVKRLLEQEQYADQFPQAEFLLKLGELEERLGISYAEEQRTAIYEALHSPMMILTGGPGTGKTTVIKGIVELFAELHGLSMDKHAYKDDEPFPFVLAAPTGRAAKRMNESTDLPSMTIHRLLGWNGVDGFQHDEENPIVGRLIIIDESSMIDTWLMNQLLKSIPEQAQVIFVGDEDQLPSVGPGQVLKDLLAAETITTARLQTIFRQEDGSSIIEMAHHMKKGKLPPDLFQQKADRSFFPCQSNQVADVVKQVAAGAIQKGYRTRDIQVLAPMYRGAAGIDALNVMLQEIFNSNQGKTKREVTFGEVTYRVGDKVLQLVNRPEINIFNGDIGEIISIIHAKENVDKQDKIYVSYDGTEAEYTRQDLIQITHAFCCSIHKSQGSEFPIVILPVVKSYYRMLRRNLIYTAITRSKQFLILCGEVEALKYGVERSIENERMTMLRERFVDNDKKEAQKSISEASEPAVEMTYEERLFRANPLIGMDNISPYNFEKVSG